MCVCVIFSTMSSSQEQKINDLLGRLRQDNRPQRPTQISTDANSSRNNGDIPSSVAVTAVVGAATTTTTTPGRPSLSLNMNTHTRKRPQDLSFTTKTNENLETDRRLKEIMKISGDLTINNVLYKTDIKDMEHIEVLGNGTCGHVVKMRHKPSNEIIAVKQMRRSGNSEENKRIIMDIEVVLKSHDCKYIVKCLGCFITDSEVWICMELMTTCFDKLLKRLGKPIPEEILGKVTVATVEALSYLKDKHGVIHRDVKPSNILLDTKGYVKLCDFGISGRLVDSMAKTRSAGCAAYLAPERIEPDPKNPDYDIRADVWSLGITLVELATGVFPYPDCNTDFEVLTKVIGQDPPSLPDTFSMEFREFVKCCLIKDQKLRPKYAELKNLPFIKKYEKKNVNVGEWVVNALQSADAMAEKAAPRSNASQSSIRRFFSSRQQQQQQQQQQTPSMSQNLAQCSLPITNGNPQSVYKQLMPINNKKLNDYHHPHNHHMAQLRSENGHISRLSLFKSNNQHQRDANIGHQQLYQSLEESSIGNNHKFPQFHHTTYQNHTITKAPQQQQELLNNLPDVADVAETKFRSSSSPYRSPPLLHENNRWRSPSASPLPLRHQFQQQNSPERSQQQYNCGNTSPIILQRFYHQQKQQQLAKEAEETGKKRFASYIKLQLSNDRSSGRSSRHQSPEPPPRYNRTVSVDNQSPLALRRNFLECSGSSSTSPTNLSRRYISPTPPVPPPRRLSESTSVPGSPQHLRARFHYTPQPQRRLFQNNDIS